MSRHCFTYGSLMCTDIMFGVAGLALQHEAAILRGHRRHPVRGEAYPGMVPAAGAQVAGVLYRDVPPAALVRLDAFEGEQYLRLTVKVELASGRIEDADTYVFRPEFAHLLVAGEWDFDSFLGEGKQRFERQYLGFGRV
ncbi:gamma-glutamylcyclotransferase [Azoarcus sp. TTM-91]|uniref:gamma-glutamylcyclotransferase family protein n=1 Tax=Azoarcus sp. TTM-91 TaxID=2691581 RepID=UPI00145E582B|nr:gamma-glutamylcyclotransferase family protein [Azoarcus sp. TTM-91]NMG35803.1 gamma-glutamylcyclotransferase [Azoarcus sp. TTM-91]